MKDEMVLYEKAGDLTVNRPPELIVDEARRAAKVLADVLKDKRKPVILNGEQYLEFEDWQTVGRFYGVTAKVVSTEYIEYGEAKGFQAKAVALRMDGSEISGAEAMCLNDEANWKAKPLFQLKSMSQTRACAKALRNVLAWVVVLAGYRPTPAEEIQDMADKKPPAKGQMIEAIQTIEAMIEKVTKSDGRKKDGSDFSKYTIHSENKKYSTFSKSIAENAKRGAQLKISANIGFRETQYGAEVVSLTLNEGPEPGTEQG